MNNSNFGNVFTNSRFISIDDEIFEEPRKSQYNTNLKINSMHKDIQHDIKQIDSTMNKFEKLSKKALGDIGDIIKLNGEKIDMLTEIMKKMENKINI